MKTLALKRIGAASLMCVLVAPVFGQQQPPTPEAPAPQQQNQAATTAPPEISKDDPDYGDPFGLYFWLTKGPGKLLPGTAAAVPVNQILALPDVRPRSFGASASMPAGKFNHLELTYFQADGDGSSYAKVPLGLFGGSIPQGDFISTSYRLRNAQLTWNYLNWPAPPEDSKWRFHSLFAFDYMSVSAAIDAPFEQNPNFTAPHGSKNLFYPALGAAAEYIPNKHFYFQARAWGFGIPQHAAIGDAEVTAVVAIKNLEIFGGYKLFHYKTSKNTDQYFVGTISGAIGGLRWVIR